MIPISKPWLGTAEKIAIQRPLKSGWLTQGPEVAQFEMEFSNYTKAKYACAVSSCTTALFLALKVVGVQKGDEVITVSHSYIATANSIRYLEAVPVFIDIDPATYNINPSLISAAITNKTKAILCVHQIGMPCDLNTIVSIAKQYKLALIEDAACAIGSQIKYKNRWEQIGKPHGDIACFSFHPRKILTTGDGGMLTTNNKKYDKQFRSLRQHGMTISDIKRHQSKQVLTEKYKELGYNFRMTDLQASIGRVQLKKINLMIRRRRKLANLYKQELIKHDLAITPYEPSWARSNWQSFCVRLRSRAQQTKVLKYLKMKNIFAKKGIMCAHREPAYKIEKWKKGSALSASEIAQDHSILLPLYHELTLLQMKRVIDVLRRFI